LWTILKQHQDDCNFYVCLYLDRAHQLKQAYPGPKNHSDEKEQTLSCAYPNPTHTQLLAALVHLSVQFVGRNHDILAEQMGSSKVFWILFTTSIVFRAESVCTLGYF